VLFIAPANSWADTFQTATQAWGDDVHTSTLNPYPIVPVSSITYADSTLNGTCVWITQAAKNYANAQPANTVWKFNWAGIAAEQKVEAGISVTNYYPWAVSTGQVNLPNNLIFPRVGRAEQAGAVISLTYTPGLNGAPVIANPVWLQAYTGTIYGNPIAGGTPILDNGTPGVAGFAYQAQSNTLPPWYAGAMGTINGKPNNAWFADEPSVPERNFLQPPNYPEYENNPIVDVQFQVVLASDSVSTRAGVTTHTVTLYGGEWWGFQYKANDLPYNVIPEPSSFALFGLGGIGIVLVRRRRSMQIAA